MKKRLYTGRYGTGLEMFLHRANYGNGRIALRLLDEQGMPQLTCTVNLPEEACPPDEVWIKDWSENEGMRKFLEEEGIISRQVAAMAVTGHVTATRHRLLISPEEM